MKYAFMNFINDEEGATAIEYGIIAGMMATILVAVFGSSSATGVWSILDALFESVRTKVLGTT